MLVVTIVNLYRTRSIAFPWKLWLLWMLYICGYLVIDFSFLGLQLTLQYMLPLLIGIVASGFIYTTEDLHWMFKWFTMIIALIYITFVFVNIFGSGFTPNLAVMPMIFSVAISLLVGLFFLNSRWSYLFFAAILFLAPIIETTRMGIAAISAIIIFHFANQNIKSKLVFGGLGLLIFLIVFDSESFQKKTFYSGTGKISDITLDYYDNPDIRSTGRISLKKALEPGLKAEPIWGNGPRADNAYLTKITKRRGGEAHNDYLSVRYNYGYVGLAILLFGFVSSFFSLYRLSKQHRESHYIWLISTSSLTLYISFLMFMFTDNILKYTIYFPNYFFAMIGIVYSLRKNEDIGCDTSLQ